MPSVAKCRSCGASIKWVLTEKGKWMPLDAEPVEGGNIAVLNDGSYVSSDPGGMRYLSHFATCPQASAHRKGTDGSKESANG